MRNIIRTVSLVLVGLLLGATLFTPALAGRQRLRTRVVALEQRVADMEEAFGRVTDSYGNIRADRVFTGKAECQGEPAAWRWIDGLSC